MVPTTKEMQRAELHKTIWRIANDLRGSVDGWDFKTYVLGMMFYRFISENLTDYINEGEWKTGDADFDYCNLGNDEARGIFEETVAEKGFSSSRRTSSSTCGFVRRRTRTSTKVWKACSVALRGRWRVSLVRAISRVALRTWTSAVLVFGGATGAQRNLKTG